LALRVDLESQVKDILNVSWNERDGAVVPSTNDVNLSDGAVRLDAAYVYADLADSTTLARNFDRRTAARVVRAYLRVMSRLIESLGGEIRSFDGDRVMGIFVGKTKRTSAAKCCLKMNWAFLNIVRPAVDDKFSSLKEGGYTLEHCAGADTGDVLLVRGGVRGSNDLVSIGEAPSIAARLSEMREAPFRSMITRAVFDSMLDEAKFTDGKPMWESRSLTIKAKDYTVYRSNWHWSI